jgi:hypothetical protein
MPPHGALGVEPSGSTVGCSELATRSYFLQVIGIERVKNEKISTPQNDTPSPTPRYRWQCDAEDQRLRRSSSVDLGGKTHSNHPGTRPRGQPFHPEEAHRSATHSLSRDWQILKRGSMI